ncbi:MAG: InlB B-repeat-containing protein [Clostridiales Family XIII bacterium]|jgi:uncharacterized repeat protein (TIGR02543 family)|nr:InlB B-repeat-containing protein [Clostridiales Family XIII bacterium]
MKKRFIHGRAGIFALMVTILLRKFNIARRDGLFATLAQRFIAGAIIVTLCTTSIISVSYAEPPTGENASGGSAAGDAKNASDFDATLERVRSAYAEALVNPSGAAAHLKTITIDTPDMLPAEQYGPTPISASGRDGGLAPMAPPVASYHVGDSRFFGVNITGSASQTYTSLPGILKAQGEHINVWVLDDAEYHAARGDTHDDTTCKLDSISPAAIADIASAFDDIYEEMTDSATGFAPHDGVIVTIPSNNLRCAGDVDLDGKVNFVLYDIYGDGGPGSGGYTSGMFSYGSFFTQYGEIDMLSVDVGVEQGYKAFEENVTPDTRIGMYSTLAHEFQHMLFFMYYGVYLVNNPEIDLSWFNESMSELAATYYTQPNTEIATFGRISSAAANTYTGGGTYSDFFAHKNLKNYGMEKLFAMNAWSVSDGHCAHDLYNHFITQYPPATTSGGFNDNKAAVLSASTMKNMTGKMLKAALGARLPELRSLSDEGALRSIYTVFMETFASDGGFFAASPPTQMKKLYGGTYGADNLWGIRSALGASVENGYLYFDDNTFTNLSPAAPLPTIASGGTISVSGYAGAPTAGNVSCEKLYKLTPTSGSSPVLNITIGDSGDTAGATRYYVALENAVSDVRHAGASGADMIPVTKGVPNIIDTQGRRAWLFVSTWFREVKNVPVTYSYKHGRQATPAAPPTLGSAADTSVTLQEEAGFEYSMDGAYWQSSGRFAGLLPDTQYRFYQRLKETDTLYASLPSPALVVTTMKKNAGTTSPGTNPPNADPPNTTPSGTTPSDSAPKVQTINVSVVFNAYGGKTDGEKTVTIAETYGAKYRLPAKPVRTGYTFSGWYTDTKSGAKVTTATTVAKKTAHTLYARWTARTFAVKFNVNKGKKLSKKLAAKKVKFGAKLGKLPAPTRPKYHFLGWYTKKSGGKKVTKSTKLSKAGTLTLYAHWKKS